MEIYATKGQIIHGRMDDDSICELHDFTNKKDVFSGVDIKGDVCYFLRNSGYHGDCKCITYDVNGSFTSIRALCERNIDSFAII